MPALITETLLTALTV